jgi:hypothetical protein
MEPIAVEKSLHKIRLQLALIIDEVELRLMKTAMEIKPEFSSRTAMSVDKAAHHNYVDSMVTTSTLPMGGDY